ncbi:MAG: hypothetical protein JNJ86_16045 [Chitinophagaceae bacterium]|nr:hypothetical protein [Chitinophagaceae bacterium]
MFGLFKKTSWKIDGKVFDFFDKLFKQLPSEFHFLSDGLNKGLYRRYSVNFAMKGHHYTIAFDPSQSDKSMTKGKQFELQNILVIQDANEFNLNITVYEGIWVGFEIKKNIIEFKNFRFDLTKLHKDKNKFAKDSKIEKLVSGFSSNNLDLNDLSEFEVDGQLYYQIKDLEDGNYIAIDNKGQVFGLIRDPYKIELINKSIKQFVDDVNCGQFDFDKYLNGQSD